MTVRKTTIRKNDFGEWVVRLWVDGVHQKDADYFTDDKQDAIMTAKFMEQRPASSIRPEEIESVEKVESLQIEASKGGSYPFGSRKEISELVKRMESSLEQAQKYGEEILARANSTKKYAKRYEVFFGEGGIFLPLLETEILPSIGQLIEDPDSGVAGLQRAFESDVGYGDNDPLPDEQEESLQIEEGDRRSDKPLKVHADLADKYYETIKAMEELQQQASAITAIISEKGKQAGALERELILAAQEYKDNVFRTQKVLITIEKIPPHKAQIPKWKDAINGLLDRLGAVSADMRKKGEAFVEACKGEIPGRTELRYKGLGESWASFTKILSWFKGWLKGVDDELDALQTEAGALATNA